MHSPTQVDSLPMPAAVPSFSAKKAQKKANQGVPFGEPDGQRTEIEENFIPAIIYALDPDHDGKTLWQQKVGRGGTSGGILWGSATDGQAIYAATTDGLRAANGRDLDPNVGGGPTAVDISGGDKLWSTPHPPCGSRTPCSPTQSAAVSAFPGVVFSGWNDGRIRAYASKGE